MSHKGARDAVASKAKMSLPALIPGAFPVFAAMNLSTELGSEDEELAFFLRKIDWPAIRVSSYFYMFGLAEDAEV